MATNNCEIYSAIRRPLDAFVQYFLDVKPYHTKLLEVLEIYNFYDTINVTIDESVLKTITFKNKPLCNPTGWGVNWDDSCGFDAISCCDLFTCIGGYGLIYNNSDLLVSANILSTSTNGTVTLSGNYSYDIKLPIKSILNADQFSVAGDQRNYFNTYNIFLVIPRHIYNINTVLSTGFVVSGNIAPEVITRGSFIVYGSAGNDGSYVVNNATYDPVTNLTNILVNETIPHVGGSGFIQVNASNKNNGAYQVLGTPTFNGVDTIVTINGGTKKFTILNDSTNGSVQFRSGLIYPRHITVSGNSANNDGDYRIMDSTYDYVSNTTTLTLSGVFQDISNTGTVNLYGYEFEAGFDANPECSIPKAADVHTVFSERLVINVIKVLPTPTPTATVTPTPTVTITPTPSGVPSGPPIFLSNPPLRNFDLVGISGYQLVNQLLPPPPPPVKSPADIAAYRALITSANPSHYWTFGDGTTGTDIIAGNNGTMVAPDGDAEIIPGGLVNAFSHTVNGGGIHSNGIVLNSAITFATTDTYTIECWVKPNHRAAGTWYGAIVGSNDGTGNGLQILSGTTGIWINYYPNYTFAASFNALQPDQWQHIVMTNDGAGNSIIYFNGINPVTFTNTYTFPIGYLGTDDLPDEGTFEMAEIATYTRVLSPTEILEHYNAGTGNFT